MTGAAGTCSAEPPPAVASSLSSTRSEERMRWFSPLLTGVLAALYFLTFTGFARFFAPAAVPSSVGSVHLWAGIVFLLPYALFQIAHGRRVWRYRGAFHFWLGIASAATLLLTVATGIVFPLIADSSGLVLLSHVLLSFAFLIVIAAHLAVVAARALPRLGTAGMSKRSLWLALVIGPACVALIGGVVLFFPLPLGSGAGTVP